MLQPPRGSCHADWSDSRSGPAESLINPTDMAALNLNSQVLRLAANQTRYCSVLTWSLQSLTCCPGSISWNLVLPSLSLRLLRRLPPLPSAPPSPPPSPQPEGEPTFR